MIFVRVFALYYFTVNKIFSLVFGYEQQIRPKTVTRACDPTELNLLTAKSSYRLYSETSSSTVVVEY